MAWYKTGTVAVAADSNAVIGTGTAFIANERVGDAFRGPDGRWYEITNIASNTAISIAPNYQGATVAAGVYTIAPMQGYVKESADRLRAITDQFKDLDQEVANAQASAAAAKLSETNAKTSETNSKASETSASTSSTTATGAATSATASKNAAATSAINAATSAANALTQADRAKTEADKLGNANAFLAAVDSVSGVVPRFKGAVQVGSSGGLTLRREDVTDPNSTANVRFVYSADNSVRLIDDAQGLTRIQIGALGGTLFGGVLTTNGGGVNIRATADTESAFLWFSDKAGGNRGAVYCEPSGALKLSPGYGQSGAGPAVTITKAGVLVTGAGVTLSAGVSITTSGDIISSIWAGGNLSGFIAFIDRKVDLKLDSAAADFAIIYPNGGTAAAPGNIVSASRFTSDNPFPGFHVMTILEVLIGGIWSEPRLDGNAGSGGASYGAYAQQILPADKIICQAGASGVALPSASTGGGHGYTGAVMTTAPVRVKVWKLKGAI